MFRNLRTSRKLFILCSMFLVALGVTTYSLVAEKLIAIEFAKKELIGSQYLATIRKAYDVILMHREENGSARDIDDVLSALQAAEANASGSLQTSELQQEFAVALRNLAASPPTPGNPALLDALAKARVLAVRIGDDSNLTLDPDLDTYYLQNIIVKKLPDILGRLGELQIWGRGTGQPRLFLHQQRMRVLVANSLLRSDVARVEENLVRAYRGNSDGSLKREIQSVFALMISNINGYLSSASGRIDGNTRPTNASTVKFSYQRAVGSSIAAWAAAQSELDRLLNLRIDGLFSRMRFSLLLTGALATLSIFIAFLTYRHIVIPLERFEAIAREISESKDYSLRMEQDSRDEIGRLAKAFNEMLSELAAARDRDITEHSELARIQRMTTLGAMSASIAHEINQPLAAIVTNSNAAQRWLGHSEPDLDEARAALRRIVDDGHRASQVIASIRATFKKDGDNKVKLSVNDLIGEVLRLSSSKLQTHKVVVKTHLSDGLPQVAADRIQLQQVLMNLIANANDAMTSVTNRPHVLRVSSELQNADSILITVEDNGSGIDQKDRDKIFDALFTTKTSGMGMGLFICQSIIESHGGRLWASPGDLFGTKFCLVLPTGKTDDA